MAFLTRLKEEKEKLDLQIQKSQIKIADLSQVIEDIEDQKTKQKREYQKEIAKIGKLIEQQKGGKYNPNECKIKQLQLQLRYVTKFNTIFIFEDFYFQTTKIREGFKKEGKFLVGGEDKRCKSEPLEPDLA